MKVTLLREPADGASTPGLLIVDGRFHCFTLEDLERETKVHGQTAIPRGTYPLTVEMSPRFKRRLPTVLNVPGFSGIRIHAGNTPLDTEGCILVGQSRAAGWLHQSRPALEALITLLEARLRHETATLTIRSLGGLLE